VLLGVFFADENMSPIQLLGLAIILVSVLLINLAKYRVGAAARASAGEVSKGPGSADNGPARTTGGAVEGVRKSGAGAILGARRAS
jgi:hypothetical protein